MEAQASRTANKVFGIGWAKTGTTTLGRCFSQLGMNHQGPRLDLVSDLSSGDFDRIRTVASQKDSFDDWPWTLLYEELDAWFPDSKFVLTTRHEVSWLRSYRNMIHNQAPATPELNAIRSTLYGLSFPDVTDEQLVERYRSHNRTVVDHFSDRPESLLVVSWEEGDGWKTLCDFLGVSIPDVPFPHANPGAYTL